MPLNSHTRLPFLPRPHPRPRDGEAAQSEDIGAVASLRSRIAAARVLREHLVWEAVRVLPALANVRAHAAFPRFRQIMEGDDLAGAILLLAAMAAPARDLLELTQAGGIWSCRMATTVAPHGRRRRIHTAHHPERAACLLAALVASGSTEA